MSELITNKGIVIQVLSPYRFRVFIKELDIELDAILSRKLKDGYKLTLKVGDEVIIKLSPYDLTQGVIDR
ncbi:MAG: translation initiation factor IF-1 [Flavobacteriales bacterium]|jgi:translation initiation factor IF-1